MGKQGSRKLIAYLPLVFVATFVVVVAPLLLVVWLRKSGAVESVLAGMAIGVVVTFLVAYAGGAMWKTRTGSRDILFSELMLWGWVHRWRSERRLNAAADLLGLTTGHPRAVPEGGLTNEQKADLLTQLSSGLEARDPYTHGHSRRVARHAASIARRMGFSRKEVAKIRAAGAMHDVGKVETPIAVLHKEGKLSDDEYAVVKRHPVDGAAMVATLGDQELTAMVRHHHERMDGTGYPDRLAGEVIPIGARIIAVADTFDAITSTRPYRHAHAHKKALDILLAGAGTQLDPDAVRAFCGCYSGRRPLAYWTILANARPRLASFLGGGLSTANAGTVANVMATAATTAAVGGAALGPLVEAPEDSSRALASAGAPDRTAKSPSRPQGSRRDELFRPQSRPDRGPAQIASRSAATRESVAGTASDPGMPEVQAGTVSPGTAPTPASRPAADTRGKARGRVKGKGHKERAGKNENRGQFKVRGGGKRLRIKVKDKVEDKGQSKQRKPRQGPRDHRGAPKAQEQDRSPAGNAPGSPPGQGDRILPETPIPPVPR